MEDRKILKSLLEGIINEQKSGIDSIKKSVESIDDSIQEKNHLTVRFINKNHRYFK